MYWGRELIWVRLRFASKSHKSCKEKLIQVLSQHYTSDSVTDKTSAVPHHCHSVDNSTSLSQPFTQTCHCHTSSVICKCHTLTLCTEIVTATSPTLTRHWQTLCQWSLHPMSEWHLQWHKSECCLATELLPWHPSLPSGHICTWMQSNRKRGDCW